MPSRKGNHVMRAVHKLTSHVESGSLVRIPWVVLRLCIVPSLIERVGMDASVLSVT